MTARPDGPEPARVLIVMGNALANLVAVTLRHGAYETRATTDEAVCLALVRDWKPHLALIDIDDHDGFIATVGGGMMRGHVPLLAFTRRRDTAVKLSAFERGADDIIEVPFTLDEIVARPYALLRRAHGITNPLVPKIQLGGQIQVDLIEQTVVLNGGRGSSSRRSSRPCSTSSPRTPARRSRARPSSAASGARPSRSRATWSIATSASSA